MEYVIATILVAIYFAPTIVAFDRKSVNTGLVFLGDIRKFKK